MNYYILKLGLIRFQIYTGCSGAFNLTFYVWKIAPQKNSQNNFIMLSSMGSALHGHYVGNEKVKCNTNP